MHSLIVPHAHQLISLVDANVFCSCRCLRTLVVVVCRLHRVCQETVDLICLASRPSCDERRRDFLDWNLLANGSDAIRPEGSGQSGHDGRVHHREVVLDARWGIRCARGDHDDGAQVRHHSDQLTVHA